MAKTKVKSLRKLDTKTALILGAGAAVLGFFVYSTFAANRDEFGGGDDGPKALLTYRQGSKGVNHDRGTKEEDPDWAFPVWRSGPGTGYAWKGPNAELKKGSYKVCFYTEKEAGGADNSIYYDVKAGSKVIASHEGPTSYDWQRKRYWRDCLSFKLNRTTKAIDFRANPKNGTFDIAKVEVFKGSATPPNADILNETQVEGQ